MSEPQVTKSVESRCAACPSIPSINKKVFLSLTGIVLYIFVLGHLAGNLQIFIGQDALNAYAAKLRHMPVVLWPVRVFLLLTLILHVVLGVKVAIENRAARPIGYVKKNTVQASIASRTMLPTGLLILAFVIYHLMHFTFFSIHPEYAGFLDAKGRHDVYMMTVVSFWDPWVLSTYIAAMFFLAVHLSHAFQSIFQTLGITDPARLKWLKGVGLALAALIFAGYASIPLAVWTGLIRYSPQALP